jgi:lipopolysaccharide/colanic/teichoic acid biosynthesis glycosyltransferase
MRNAGGKVGIRIERALIRGTDYVLAFALIIFLLPMLALVAAWTALRCGLPILERDRVYGPGGEALSLVRFRGAADAGGHDVDELILMPRLFNVLAGDLSMVGPPTHLAPTKRRGQAPSTAKPGLIGAPANAGRISYSTYWATLARGAIATIRR